MKCVPESVSMKKTKVQAWAKATWTLKRALKSRGSVGVAFKAHTPNKVSPHSPLCSGEWGLWTHYSTSSHHKLQNFNPNSLPHPLSKTHIAFPEPAPHHAKRRRSQNLPSLAGGGYFSGWHIHPLLQEDDGDLRLRSSWDCGGSSSRLGLLQPWFLSLDLPCNCWGKGQFSTCPRIWISKVPPFSLVYLWISITQILSIKQLLHFW